MIDFAAITDVGRVRSENQDRWFADAELGLFLVADGLGGHAAGALAAQLVVDFLPRLVRRTLTTRTNGTGAAALTPCPSPEYRRGETSDLIPGPYPQAEKEPRRERLRTYPTNGRGELHSAIADQVKVLSNLVYKETRGQPGVNGTGTTLVLALVDSRHAMIVHAGDSRAYLLRRGQLQQVTQDHTLAQLLVRNHELSASAVGQHPAAGRLTRYVGMPGAFAPDSQTISFVAGDLLLLCSDGLHGEIDDDEICGILRSGKTIEAMGHELVDASNRAGGRDNVTILLISPGESAQRYSYAMKSGDLPRHWIGGQ